ncbi:hypothetical protein [Pedobacter roseus]|uniref:Uncharacterized protein n=1 Tax=Pedobacter roseus TaxID=336820 RepID=A0A7G9QGZ7_9SPHI|nr:hypothetical protein [Pedobacter roseus]QNN42622.1 hypothetical protein H9L23_00440 [Pedobacter roseus]
MTFDLQQAKELIAHYQFIIGQPLDKKNNAFHITTLAIVPDDGQKIANILSSLNENNNMILLAQQGYDVSSVKVVAAHIDKWNGNTFYNDLDSFLERNNLKKIYE